MGLLLDLQSQKEIIKSLSSTIIISVNIVQANDQKKLKKMVEELANKYGKTEDEIFYAYDQWVFY